jgi:DNA-binding CsgD family transcriptional regulator
VIQGRESDLAAIDDLLADVRLRRSRVLLVRGEAGIGKTALLEYAQGRSDGLHQLRATGTPSEAELPFATLHQLLWPIFAGLERLPHPQAEALRSAFGLADPPAGGPDRFLVAAAALTLLADAAESEPVLCLIDDLHWADEPSVAALRFVARRIHSEGIALLAATRSPGPDDGLGNGRSLGEDLPSRTLNGLPTADAMALLTRWYGDRLAPEVAAELADRVNGSPLALREIPALLSTEQCMGRQPLPDPLPVGPGLEMMFRKRLQALPGATRRLLEAAAADGVADLDVLLQVTGSREEDVEAAEVGNVVRITGTGIEFVHPLLRSAVYGAMTPTRRRDLHRTLANVIGDQAPDRRAWHLAAASIGPDAEAAHLLESTADRAQRRSGHAAAATAMLRAADLSADPVDRARRLIKAADAAWSAGQPVRAQNLIEQAAGITEADPAAVARVRGLFQLREGLPAQAVRTLTEGARCETRALPALEMLMSAAEAASYAGDPSQLAAIGHQADGIGVDGDRARYLNHVLTGTAALLGGDHQSGLALLTAADQLADTFEDPTYLRWATFTAVFAGSGQIDDRNARLVQRLRDLGAIGELPYALQFPAITNALTGHLDQALNEASEGLRLARDTGQESASGVLLAALAVVAALRGQEGDCRRAVDQSLRLGEARQQGMAVGFAMYAQGMLDLGLGRPQHALEQFQRMADAEPGHGHPAITAGTLSWHIDAAIQTGDPEAGRAALRRHEAWTNRAGPYNLSMLAYCQARLADGPGADALYRRALELTDAVREPFAFAQRQLAYGQHLRRQRQRSASRTHLREALARFQQLDCHPWAARALEELRATGESAHRAPVGAPVPLTPQESQITTLVADGLSNREIAAQLFLSARTVEYHLRKVFQKLGISSRTELIRAGRPVAVTLADPATSS